MSPPFDRRLQPVTVSQVWLKFSSLLENFDHCFFFEIFNGTRRSEKKCIRTHYKREEKGVIFEFSSVKRESARGPY